MVSEMAFHQEYFGIEQPAVGQLIREFRQTLKLTREKLTAQMGVTFPTINRWENRHAAPSLLTIKQIDILGNQMSQPAEATLRERSRAMRGKYFSSQQLKA